MYQSNTCLVIRKPLQNLAFIAEALDEWKEHQDLEKRLMGDAYTDFGPVLAQVNGRPFEAKTICKRLRDFCKQEGLPNICTHSLRHTSIDIKLELSDGSIRDVMADAGQPARLFDAYFPTAKSRDL